MEVKSVLVEMQDNDYMKDVSEEEVNAMEATTNAVKQQRKQTGSRRRTPVPVSFEHRHRAQSIIQSKALDELETEVFETGLYENHDLSTGSSYGVFAAEIFFSKVSLHSFARACNQMCTVYINLILHRLHLVECLPCPAISRLVLSSLPDGN